MKKLLAFSLSLMLCLLTLPALGEQANDYTEGSIVTFGSYEQDNDLENGKEPIEWIVLKVEDDKAMLISRLCLDARAYHKAFVTITWAECTMREWLNDTFLNEAFSAEEQAKIIPTFIINEDRRGTGTPGGEDTTDRVYFLSYSETIQFFPDDAGRTAQPTAYAVAHGAYVDKTNGNAWWWLRTPGDRNNSQYKGVDVCGVRADGRISGYGSRDVNRPSGSVRPVIWIDISK